MCGIVGIISKDTKGFWNGDLKIFRELLWADQLRGIDGTGVFFVDKEGKSEVDKEPIPASNYLHSAFDKIESKIFQKGRILIGHNRAATKGSKIKANTHPFQEGHVTLVHNGTLYSHKHLKDVEVDSHAICHSMREQGYARTLKELWGAFALVWYNESNKRLYLTRNSERPLNIIESKSLFVISSEPGLATWILERNKEEAIKVTELKVGKLYSFKLDDLSSFKDKEVELHKTPFQKTSYPITTTTKSTTAITGSIPKIGERFKFYPIRVYWEKNKPVLYGMVQEEGLELDVLCYGEVTDYTEFKKLENELCLSGVLRATVHYPTSNKTDYLVRDLLVAEDSIPSFVSKNNTTLTKEEVDNLDGTACDTCGGFINMSYLKKMYVRKENNRIEFITCHECSNLAERYEL